MALTTEQKVDLLLKKLGYTKTKTGSVFGTGSVSGTGKQPFGEAIPSPLIVANGSLWNEADLIPASPPGSDTNQVKRYPTTSAIRMTLDNTVTPNRSFIAYTTYNNTSSARLTNWIDTQFGPDYQLEVYVDDATDSDNKLPEGGSGSNDGWYFDYSAGVLNFSDTNIPSGVNGAGTNVYIVGYRYIGKTGATVLPSLDVTGVSTFRDAINALDIIKGYKYLAAPYSGTTTTLTVTVATKISGEHIYHGQGSSLGYVIDGLQSPFFTLTPGRTYRFDQSDSSNNFHQLRFYLEADKTTLYEEGVTYAGTAGSSGAYTEITVSDTTPVVLHYQCVNHAFMGNAFQSNTNVVNTNHEATLRGGLNVTGVSTFSSNVDINADIDVDGHTELDNVNVSGMTTFAGEIDANGKIVGAQLANVIPFYYDNVTDFPSASTYHGAVAHAHNTGKLYFAHSGWKEIVSKEANGTIGVGTEVYNIGTLTVTGDVSIGGTLTYEDVTNIDAIGIVTARSGIKVLAGGADIVGVVTATGADINGDLDVDGHTNLDNVSVSGAATITAPNNAMPFKIATSKSSGGIGTYLFTNSVGRFDFKFENTYNGNWHTGSTFHTRLLWAAPNESDTTPEVCSIMPNTASAGASGKLSALEFSVTDNTSGLKKAYEMSSNRHQFLLNGNQVGLDINSTLGVGVTSYIYHGYTGGASDTNTRLGFASNHNIIFDTDGTERLRINNSSSTFAHNIVASADLDVDGHTNLDNVSIAGVTTIAQDLDVDGHTNLDNVNIVGVTTHEGHVLPSADSTYDLGSSTKYWRHVYADNIGVGTDGTTIGVDIVTRNLQVNGISTHVGIATFNDATFHGDLDVDGHTNLDNVSIAGVTTMTGMLRINSGNLQVYGTAPTLFLRDTDNNPDYRIMNSHGSYKIFDETNGVDRFIINPNGKVNILYDLDVDGHTNLDNVSIAGVTTIAQDLDVDGHTNLDNVSIAGVTTVANNTEFIFGTNSTNTDRPLKIKHQTSNTRNQVTADYIDFNVIDARFIDISNGNHIAKFWNSRVILCDGNGNDRLETKTNGVEITGLTDTDTLNTGNATFTGTISAGGGTGTNGQYLKTTGSGVAWASFPTLRTRDTQTASAGQTTFTFNYTVNFIDVYVNGIKLTDSEFTATNGTSVVLAVGCFVGDIVELVSYNGVSTGSASGSLNNVVEDVTPQLGGNLDLFNKTINGTGNINIVGVATATKFIGDGSGLTGVTASGSGIIVKDGGSTVGTAQTIDFGTNLSLSPASAGIVTVTATDTQLTNEEVQDIVGAMFTGNTETNITATYQDTDGTIDLVVDNGVSVANQADNRLITATGTTDALNAESGLTFDGNTLALTGNQTISDDLNVTGISTFAGITTVTGNTLFTKDVSVSGVITATTFKGAIETTSLFSSGNVDFNANLDVDGHTELDNVNVSGVITATTFKGALEATSGSFSSNIDANGDLDVDGHTNLDNVSVAGVTTFAGNVKANSHINLPDNSKIKLGDSDEFRLHHDNSGNSYIVEGATGNLFIMADYLRIQDANGNNKLTTSADGVSIPQDLDVDGHTDLDNVSISGVTTFTGNIDANADLDVDGHTNLDNVSIAGVTTFTGAVSIGDSISVADNKRIYFGDDQDLSIRHNEPGHSYIQQSSGKDIVIQTGVLRIVNTADNEGLAAFKEDSWVQLYYDGTVRFSTSGVGVTIYNQLDTTNLNISGVSTFAGNIDANGDLDVDGHTNLDNLSVAGVSTFSNNVHVGTGITFETNGQATYTGIVTALKFVGDGSGLTNLPGGGSYGNNDVDSHLNVSGASSGQILSWNGSDYAWVADQTGGGGGGGSQNLFSTIAVSGQSNVVADATTDTLTLAAGSNVTITTNASTDTITISATDTNTQLSTEEVQDIVGAMFTGNTETNITATYQDTDGTIDLVASADVGITTNISGSFTATGGSSSNIDSYAYSANDAVVEYTVFIKNGSDYQSQKLLAMRDGTTTHSSQFAVMFSSSLLFQFDTIISSGNIVLRATAESGVTGTTTYRVKREVL